MPSGDPGTLDDVPHPTLSPATDTDLAVMREQLGRPMRGVVGIAARCVCGNPTVVATEPRLPESAGGAPFPTFYYLTHPGATAAMSALEAGQVMPEYAALLAMDETVARAYAAAHEAYLSDRSVYGEVPEIAGISAGGMPTRVKCLHALAGHALAAGPGVNPIGDLALARGGWSPERCTCATPGAGLARQDEARPEAARESV